LRREYYIVAVAAAVERSNELLAETELNDQTDPQDHTLIEINAVGGLAWPRGGRKLLVYREIRT